MRCGNKDIDAYRLLFEIESYLRIIVRWELKTVAGTSMAGSLPPAILEEALRRRKQEEDLGYLDSRKSAILSYLHLTELKDILLDTIWEFSSFDRWAGKDLLTADFKKLCGVRNKIAHFRPITNRDSRIIKSFSADLEEWTKPYRRKREYSNVFSGPEEFDEFCKKKKIESVSAAVSDFRALRKPTCDALSITSVLGHLAVDITAEGGSISLADIEVFLVSSEKEITFARIGEQARRLCIYAPLCLGDATLSRLIGRFLLLIDRVEEPKSSEEIEDVIGVSKFESVVDWEIDLPAAFEPS